MADYNYIIEDHQELTGIGRRTHEQIDAILDDFLTFISNSGGLSAVWHNFTHKFEESDLLNEVSPSIIRVALPAGMSLTNSPIITGSIDGRISPEGQGWRPSVDGNAIEIYIPVDQIERSLYLRAQPVYRVVWLGA